MSQTTAPSYDVCDACRRPILGGDGIRLIHSYRIHLTDECFSIYSEKVEKNLLKVPFTLDHKNIKKPAAKGNKSDK